MDEPGGSTTYDAWGVPHCVADTVEELAWRQGHEVALHRTWQVTWSHWRALGTTAAAVGAAGLPWDRFARRAQLLALARRAFDGLDAETQGFVAAFSRGVTTGLQEAGPVRELDALGLAADQPGSAWDPWTPLGVFVAGQVLFASFPSKLWRRHVGTHLAPAVARLLGTDPDLGAGSNAWAVGGGRTASGRPLIGGDSHRTFEAPNVYSQVRLTCTSPRRPEQAFDVTGFTFPGVPGVQHFAHAGPVAWGITNAMADYQDSFEVRLRRRSGPSGPVQARSASGWYDAPRSVERVEVRDAEPVDVEVLVTRHGPVVTDPTPVEPATPGDEPEERALTLLTPSWTLGELGFAALLPLLRARDVSDVESALEHWVEPVNNLVAADTSGAVLQRIVGRVPARPSALWVLPGDASSSDISSDTSSDMSSDTSSDISSDISSDTGSVTGWAGWVDPPRREVGPDEAVVTANNRMDADFDRIGWEFAHDARAARIAALLSGRDDLTTADFARIHRDALRPDSVLVRLTRQALADGAVPPGAAARALLDWDGRMEPGSTGAAVFDRLRTEVVHALVGTEALAGLSIPSPFGPLLASWFDPAQRVAVALDALLGSGDVLGIDPAALVVDALRRVDGSVADDPPAGASYGEQHVFTPAHALGWSLAEQGVPRTPVGGDLDCVFAASSLPGAGRTHRGPVTRYVWDLAERSAGGWAVPLGTDGDTAGAHGSDQLPLWADGRLAPLPPS